MESAPLTYALAFGSSGDWTVEILETEDVGLTLVIQHPYLYLQTELPSVELAQRLRDMLASRLEETPEVFLGRMLGAEVEASIFSYRLWSCVRGGGRASSTGQLHEGPVRYREGAGAPPPRGGGRARGSPGKSGLEGDMTTTTVPVSAVRGSSAT